MIAYIQGKILKKEGDRVLVLANQIGFEILVPEQVALTPEPTPEQLRILREIDPQGLVIGK